jgi:hypothetical protein
MDQPPVVPGALLELFSRSRCRESVEHVDLLLGRVDVWAKQVFTARAQVSGELPPGHFGRRHRPHLLGAPQRDRIVQAGPILAGPEWSKTGQRKVLPEKCLPTP